MFARHGFPLFDTGKRTFLGESEHSIYKASLSLGMIFDVTPEHLKGVDVMVPPSLTHQRGSTSRLDFEIGADKL